MATITINIPDGQLTRVVDALCNHFNYETLIDGLPNPETRNLFARRMMIELIKRAVSGGEAKMARLAADSQVNIT